jgi:hypothetical protein
MEPVKVVAHYLNGELIKGFTQDFSPNKPLFHIYPNAKSIGEGVIVLMKDLKALFFVKDFVGDSTYNERKHFSDGQNVPGKKLEVLFADDELLVGSTLGYDPIRQGFFLFPADSKTNNIRVYSIASTLKKVRFL